MKNVTLKNAFIKMLLIVSVIMSTQNAFAQIKPSDGSVIKKSIYSFSDTVDILTGAIEGQNLMIIKIIDGQRMLRMAGKQINGMKQIFFFNPIYMKRVMDANKEATIQIPLKMIVMEKPNKIVIIKYFKPSTLLNAYKGEEAIAKELDGLIDNIVSEIMK
ncbi:MAG: hypothetical protein COA66_10210 [Arcobacter sp.]|nr:MAG: hypothetical protein COA66_10210 [Arcobacter sp.]